MKSLRVLFASVILAVSFLACSSDHDDVTPDQSQNLEKFEVKSDGVSGGGVTPTDK